MPSGPGETTRRDTTRPCVKRVFARVTGINDGNGDILAVYESNLFIDIYAFNV